MRLGTQVTIHGVFLTVPVTAVFTGLSFAIDPDAQSACGHGGACGTQFST